MPRIGLLLFALVLAGCAEPQQSGGPPPPGTIVVTSPAFANGERIPQEYTCDGANDSPPLNLHNVPPLARSLLLVVEDPDAPSGTFTHWTAWNMSADTRSIPRAADISALGGREGLNDGGEMGYTGPCPPSGSHRYYFRVYALAKPATLPAGSAPAEVAALLEGDVLGRGELMGTYEKR